MADPVYVCMHSTAPKAIDWPRTLHMQLEPRVGPGGILGLARNAYFSF